MNSPFVVTQNSWFEGLWGKEIPLIKDGYPFHMRVVVAGYRMTPRHSMFEYFRDMGMTHIPNIIFHRSFGSDFTEAADKTKDLLFVFPERWMSVHEQQAFLHRLKTHPNASKIRLVDIVTQSALVVTNCFNVHLVQLLDDDPEASLVSSEMC